MIVVYTDIKEIKMTELIEKYLGEKKEEIDEAHGRGMLRLMHTRNPKN
jgi:hypothetical protein